jgi:hypothetical protein
VVLPDFTVIEGGGPDRPPPEDFEALAAEAALRMLAIELLRAMVRGDDDEARVERALEKFSKHFSKSTSSAHSIISKATKDLHQDLKPDRDRSSLSMHTDRIVVASLRVAAEQCCDDNAAAGRRSGREQDLRSAIDGYNRWHNAPRRR